MLTQVTIRNFKRFEEVKFELGRAVVLIGPNNCGKSTALQALALWEIGLKQWLAKRATLTPGERPGVTINRNGLISIPTPNVDLLWRDSRTRKVHMMGTKPQTENIRIDVIVDGESGGNTWQCGLEFDYANPESLYCRPLRLGNAAKSGRMTIPEQATKVLVSFLPPMSGLAGVEPKWESGRIRVLLGEGQTAQVLRNLCYQIHEKPDDWRELNENMRQLFGIDILPPKYVEARGEITMSYRERGIKLDLANCGRGAQQTLLLLAHLYANPGTVLLLDEPDAHLEILRQRQTYRLITELAGNKSSQVVAASHSEVVLEEAASRDIVIAFVGKPHRIDDRGSQLGKSLKDIGFDDFYLAEQTGWVLYLEGSTDLDILRSFAKILKHEAAALLEQPFVKYVGRDFSKARGHFHGLKEAKRDLVAIGIYDRQDLPVNHHPQLAESTWRRREIENYVCQEVVLIEYARDSTQKDFGPLFKESQAKERIELMKECIREVSEALRTLNKPDPWSSDIKASEDFLEPVFTKFFNKLGLSNQMHKSSYHVLASFVSAEKIDSEVCEKLDAIVSVARKAKPEKD
ncbi:MAG TPA: AAA family ATPase [Candidatus Deferrimicrobium sp.]|nr:AAA family ATPase [Candidatus Deferrimicrobium sp.]